MALVADGRIGDDFLATHTLHPIHRPIVFPLHVVSLSLDDDSPHHHAMFAQAHGQPAGVDASQGGDAFALQPGRERLLCVPMGKTGTVVGDNQCCRMDAATLHINWQSVASNRGWGDAVVAYQWIGHRQYLTRITRVGQTIRISCHGGIEHHFPNRVLLVAE